MSEFAYLSGADDDVMLDVLAGIDTTTITGSQELDGQIERLLPHTKRMIDALCRRDFDDHANATVYCDGSGGESLLLPYPIRTDLAIYTLDASNAATVVSASTYRVRRDIGLVKFIDDAPTQTSLRNQGNFWPRGFQNIKAVLDWGYPDGAPVDVLFAQAHMIRAELLSRVDVANRSMKGGIERETIGVWTIAFAVASAYRDHIQQSMDAVRALVADRGTENWSWRSEDGY